MKFARPFLPAPADRAHVTAGLRLLAEYIEDYPHVFQVQRDARALLSPAELRQVAKAMNDPESEYAPDAPFFYSEERESIRVGLLALADMSRLFGSYATANHFAEIFEDRGIPVASPEGMMQYLRVIEQIPAIDELGLTLESPHKALPPLESTYLVSHTAEHGQSADAAPAAPVYDPDVPPLHQMAPSL